MAGGLSHNIAAVGGPAWELEEAEKFIAEWYGIYDGIYHWTEGTHARARRYGMVWTAFGRHRYIPEVYSAHRYIRNKGLRQAGNTPIQGSAGDHLKIAMAEVAGLVEMYRATPGVICWPLLQVHDELVFEVSKEIAEEFGACVNDIMTMSVPLSIPVRAGAEIGDNWGELK